MFSFLVNSLSIWHELSVLSKVIMSNTLLSVKAVYYGGCIQRRSQDMYMHGLEHSCLILSNRPYIDATPVHVMIVSHALQSYMHAHSSIAYANENGHSNFLSVIAIVGLIS